MISKEAKKDIKELMEKIHKLETQEMQEEKFKAYRLTRGIYGQRQEGVHMFRLKLPMGRITAEQLRCVAQLSDEYSTGNLHFTTRQNIQLHYVELKNTPEILEKLDLAGLTAREACGNTVRNITASPLAGVDKDELFDVSPYAYATFKYFLRHSICQDMGRKIKPAFSSSNSDSAFTFMHDFGLIPRMQNGSRGFKMVVGGGLGAQPFVAQKVSDFIPDDEIIPTMVSMIRVFDRYGERERRLKARMKYMLDEKRGLGLQKFMELAEVERKVLTEQKVSVDYNAKQWQFPAIPDVNDKTDVKPLDEKQYSKWLNTNVIKQKQKGYNAVALKIVNGNISSDIARKLATIIEKTSGDDSRITANQGLMLRYVDDNILAYLFNELHKIGLADYGYDTTADVVSCPGTDTCNLGVSNSTFIAREIGNIIKKDYHYLVQDSDIKIKLSGCMNACGQHTIAQIGFHGSSIRNGTELLPALQVLLGGGVTPTMQNGDYEVFIAEKIIKLPTRKIPNAIKLILEEFEDKKQKGEYFNHYYRRMGKKHFYDLLKPLADLSNLSDLDRIDWGDEERYVQAIGVGECASVAYDMISTILNDVDERIQFANEHLIEKEFSHAVYHTYSANIIAAKALLLSQDISCNTQIGIIKDFDEHITGKMDSFHFDSSFENFVLQIKNIKADEPFANNYMEQSMIFINQIKALSRDKNVLDKIVINNYYKA